MEIPKMRDDRDKPSVETCPHGFGFVEYCHDCAPELLEAARLALDVWDSDSASLDPDEVRRMLADAIEKETKRREKK